jgi:hypothetical protein
LLSSNRNRSSNRRSSTTSGATTTTASSSTTMLHVSGDVREAVTFPAVPPSPPVLLDSKEHVVGYLSKILNARVYDAAIETELQYAKNLSAVRAVTVRL